jgi:hypothetical protein
MAQAQTRRITAMPEFAVSRWLPTSFCVAAWSPYWPQTMPPCAQSARRGPGDRPGSQASGLLQPFALAPLRLRGIPQVWVDPRCSSPPTLTTISFCSNTHTISPVPIWGSGTVFSPRGLGASEVQSCGRFGWRNTNLVDLDFIQMPVNTMSRAPTPLI